MYSPIIPIKQNYYKIIDRTLIPWENKSTYNLDLESILSFISIGFMLDDDTYFTEIKTLKPATEYKINDKNQITTEERKWSWHYKPIERSFENILDEFSSLFNRLIIDSTKEKNVLLPISGGLDSRSLFIPVSKQSNLILCSYEFDGGLNETYYGRELSERFNIPFYSQKIPRGYLWEKLDQIAELNGCFTDFTHPRQVAVMDNWKGLGEVILLGHWGDVLFDKQADSKNISYNEQVIQLKKKIIKPGGIELANDLWRYWGLEGSFESYITDRLDKLYGDIDIDHPSARMRAFKSLYWAPRWTSINLSTFNKAGEIVLPYYSDEMCKFICTVPERYLVGRKIQIEYIKKNCPEAARLPWQKYYPLNLYQYHRFNQPQYYFVRAIKKTNRIFQKFLSKSPDLITRNWELQFLGDQNIIQLKKNLLEKNKFNKLIPQTIIRKYLDKFQTDPVQYAHPLSMLLTLAVFSDKHYSE